MLIYPANKRITACPRFPGDISREKISNPKNEKSRLFSGESIKGWGAIVEIRRFRHFAVESHAQAELVM
jgi:hypothetical protein